MAGSDEQERVILVDPADRELGVAPKLAAHESGLLHRAFSIFVFRVTDGALLMQQRHLSKYHCPGLWSNTCCGHPRPGESIQMAAERRLFEELHLQIPLKWQQVFEYRADCGQGMIEHELDHVLVGEITPEDFLAQCQPHPDEIAAVDWVQPATLIQALKTSPERYTPWLKQALQIGAGGRLRP